MSTCKQIIFEITIYLKRGQKNRKTTFLYSINLGGRGRFFHFIMSDKQNTLKGEEFPVYVEL